MAGRNARHTSRTRAQTPPGSPGKIMGVRRKEKKDRPLSQGVETQWTRGSVLLLHESLVVHLWFFFERTDFRFVLSRGISSYLWNEVANGVMMKRRMKRNLVQVNILSIVAATELNYYWYVESDSGITVAIGLLELSSCSNILILYRRSERKSEYSRV